MHGLGFASVLAEFGLPEGLYFAALFWFNVGVEFAQIGLLVAAYLGVTVWFSCPEAYRRYVVLPGSLVIGGVGTYWMAERIFYFYFS